MLLLHGFPEFWYAWHHQLTALADAGFRAVAADLRGYGASDKPPRGYDGYTMAGDVAGLIRALGERSAMLVGAGYGGMVAWTTAAFHPKMVRRMVIVGAAHPLRLRAGTGLRPARPVRGGAAGPEVPDATLRARADPGQRRAGRGMLAKWGGPAWVASPAFTEYQQNCRDAMRIPQAAFCAMETYRWSVRAVLRLQGYRFVKLLQQPIIAPTLQLHGALDTAVLPRTAQGSGRYVIADYEWRLIPDVGHFPHLETPDVVSGELIRWAKELRSGTRGARGLDLVAGRPSLVDAVVELLEGELGCLGSQAAGVLDAQPAVVLAEDDEWLALPRTRRADVDEVVNLAGRHDPAIAARADLFEPVVGVRSVEPNGVAVRAGLVLGALPAGRVAVTDHDSPTGRHRGPSASSTATSSLARPRRAAATSARCAAAGRCPP